MVRFETVQGDVWEGERKIREQLAWIELLRENGFCCRDAVKELREMEETQESLMHHRNVLRQSLRRA